MSFLGPSKGLESKSSFSLSRASADSLHKLFQSRGINPYPLTPLEKASSVPTGASLSSPETMAIPLAADEARTLPRSTFASSWRRVAACAGLDRRARKRLISASQSGGKESSSSPPRACRGGRREASRWRRPAENEETLPRAFFPPKGVADWPCFAGAARECREHVEARILEAEKTRGSRGEDAGR